ncbi:MAG: GTP cyclohydrolase FolE2 [Pseudotabrizicola sp.]|uniref:GTP cyclohydrolase FolE2 n=1 Tax=Pseudotabrizicola sp. TaxID=2939647 RepID=UPI00271FCBA2|nr:GTP cyclohydrolase FolE2 [Pseudotabrizicola sp.]MDO8882834.1 GTP cyclohydrolase FolE2 [Pseudotabrizicola sp.]MDP2083455.1 GTP cyclohydrolase FolE2 [Pseudotabrizicola sp.]MDZ7572840.1 GTP cyclohydrolase FolE2 [Pseudotabrizicola sp.]
MNIHTPEIDRKPSRTEAEAALALLRQWATKSSDDEIATLEPVVGYLLPDQGAPALSRIYPLGFEVTDAYKASLPDLQNGPSSLIRGAKARIQHVGISNFRLPIRYKTRDGAPVMLETSVTGTVSLEADKKGINMSRIMRSFYAHADSTFGFAVIEAALDDYKADLGSYDARIQLRFSYPVKVQSLRSGLSGWQYYDVAFELVEAAGVRKKIVHLDYVYSSTCPCSLELSEHARSVRGQLATPHSQRSVARISVEVLDDQLSVEDLIEAARAGVVTETQVMVKREDEQAFAELNAANPIFVEDAARSFCAVLMRDPRIGDFRVLASHQESLHSHDAVSLLTEGPTFAQDSLDPRLFQTLFHIG